MSIQPPCAEQAGSSGARSAARHSAGMGWEKERRRKQFTDETKVGAGRRFDVMTMSLLLCRADVTMPFGSQRVAAELALGLKPPVPRVQHGHGAVMWGCTPLLRAPRALPKAAEVGGGLEAPGWEVFGCVAEPPSGPLQGHPWCHVGTWGQRRAGDAVTAPCAPTPPAWFQHSF